MRLIPKPLEGEYDPYTIAYISLLPDDGLVIQHLVDQMEQLKALVENVADEALSTPHAEGEWTIKDILIHITDDERVFAYRALRFARNDSTHLAGLDDESFVRHANANQRSLASLLEEYESVRTATITLFKNLPEEALTRGGLANNHLVTVRALAYITAGHELHHIHSIRENYSSVLA